MANSSDPMLALLRQCCEDMKKGIAEIIEKSIDKLHKELTADLMKCRVFRMKFEEGEKEVKVFDDEEEIRKLTEEGEESLTYKHSEGEDSNEDSELELSGEIHKESSTSSSISLASLTESHSATKHSIIVEPFFKLRCEAWGTNIVKSGSRTVAPYFIPVTEISNSRWFIKRRFRRNEPQVFDKMLGRKNEEQLYYVKGDYSFHCNYHDRIATFAIDPGGNRAGKYKSWLFSPFSFENNIEHLIKCSFGSLSDMQLAPLVQPFGKLLARIMVLKNKKVLSLMTCHSYLSTKGIECLELSALDLTTLAPWQNGIDFLNTLVKSWKSLKFFKFIDHVRNFMYLVKLQNYTSGKLATKEPSIGKEKGKGAYGDVSLNHKLGIRNILFDPGGYFWESRTVNAVDSDSYRLNSSLKLCESGITVLYTLDIDMLGFETEPCYFCYCFSSVRALWHAGCWRGDACLCGKIWNGVAYVGLAEDRLVEIIVINTLLSLHLRAREIASQLHYEITTISDFASNYICQSPPFGGVKDGGFGRFAGIEGLLACCLVKFVVQDYLPFSIRVALDGPVNTFLEVHLLRPLLWVCGALGYTMPSFIQVTCIPLTLTGCDTGGSAIIRPKDRPAIRVLILTLTRGLVVQIHIMIGKVREVALRSLPDTVVATPGLMIDHLRNSLSEHLDELAILILGEVDGFLELGFSVEIHELVKWCPKQRRAILLSATMTKEIDGLIKLSLNKHLRLSADSTTKRPTTLTEEVVRICRIRERSGEAVFLALCSKTFTCKMIITPLSLPRKSQFLLQVPYSSLPLNTNIFHPPSLRFNRHSSSSVFTLDSDMSSPTLSMSYDLLVVSSHPWPEWIINGLKAIGYPANTTTTTTQNDDKKGVVAAVCGDMKLAKGACLILGCDCFDTFRMSTQDIQIVGEKSCPNLLHEAAKTAKRLRAYLELDKGDVGYSCNLRGSCARAYIMLNDSEAVARTIDIVCIEPLVISERIKPTGRYVVELSARKLLLELIELGETPSVIEITRHALVDSQRNKQSLQFLDNESSKRV